ncbi:TRAP transporter small permease [Parasphingorhabdus cellanae]|uniref:TRAP transporter small permease protein n=1 Tax=Parasphingorhabdus cellanae TaxID=2806553 RepID=A0ABX7TB73_9SPHN|nr:TRAP transporter small permease [Parasphingorhabdus cellanae]QTD57628.1 TRAP transporter small permease [Parasphingorhabdus cellanae]
MLDKASDWLIRLGAAGLVIMTAVIGWQVFGRFVLQSSPSWSEQAALLLMIWYVLFAAAAGVREGFHIRIALLEDMSSPAMARRIRMVIHCLVALFGIILFVYGSQLVWLVRDHVIPSLGLSRGFAYIPLPVSGFLMAIFALFHARDEWRGNTTGEDV